MAILLVRLQEVVYMPTTLERSENKGDQISYMSTTILLPFSENLLKIGPGDLQLTWIQQGSLKITRSI